MNVHKNARSCPLSRELLVKRVCEQGWSVRAASEAGGMSDRRGREWVRRAERGEPFTDRSSRPCSGRATSAATRVRIVHLRRQWFTIRQIASAVGVGTSTAARVCRAAGLSRLKQLDAPPPAVRYERDRPGELLHIDVSAWAASTESVIESRAAAPTARANKDSSSCTSPLMTLHVSVTPRSFPMSAPGAPFSFSSTPSTGSRGMMSSSKQRSPITAQPTSRTD